tara:strand:- start:5932 stop:6234 length:303 start_codon:yes stop_codon:yes gene_type:complete
MKILAHKITLILKIQQEHLRRRYIGFKSQVSVAVFKEQFKQESLEKWKVVTVVRIVSGQKLLKMFGKIVDLVRSNLLKDGIAGMFICQMIILFKTQENFY